MTIALITASVALVAVVGFFLLADRNRRQASFREKSMEAILPNRLQAYERLTLYVERIRPENMVLREQMQVNTSLELHTLLVNSIRQEFEHNIAMQIYISSASWSRILRAREEVQKTLANVAKETNPKASSLEFGRKVMERAKNECDFYVDRALEGLRRDINGLFVSK